MTEQTFCRTCGAEILEKSEICPKCGVRQFGVIQNQIKNPGFAAVASFLWVGLGQIYNGEIGKGLLFMVIQIVNALLVFIVIGLVTFPVFWAYGIYDAYKTAEKINNNGV
ncbi:hypothetical protein MSLAZ_3084 [Methanosarcina lacustris Z-7289]|uniref:Zinc-ribbon domain-containing protein n=1 Tax=Methanosarcina lacustris Z-7289 TaxID=1434111 RepID=A0A0E3WSF1_9EURY|nr:zinc-ribbon domain-containing protein [Methanosarcina lacustris]AKB76345.1 hypothetical protein MSLAZ_3084 [Methanosarcina lacustris Z-7289]